MERIRTVVSACALAVCAAGSCAAQSVLRYDASLGTLPTAQGFSLFDDQWTAAPSVRQGVLEQGMTDFSTSQFHHARHDTNFADGVVIRASIYVHSSTYHLNSCASAIRFGYYLGAIDREGRMAYVGLGDGHVFVLTHPLDRPDASRPVVSYPVRGGWRDIEMIIKPEGIDLRIDGASVRRYPLGAAGVVAPGEPRVIFGDGTACGASRTSLRWVEFAALEPCPADFNGDGFVDFVDYDDFVACFEGFWCPPGTTADFNGDGFVDMFDYDDFVALFEQGCGNGDNQNGGGDGSGGSGGGGGQGGSGGGSDGSGGGIGS